jgi:hypothetical protein
MTKDVRDPSHLAEQNPKAGQSSIVPLPAAVLLDLIRIHRFALQNK